MDLNIFLLQFLIFNYVTDCRGIGVKNKNILEYVNRYGDGYGSTWIYFPDGDGIPHRINLTVPQLPRLLEVHDIEYRLYTRKDPDNYIILNDSGSAINEVDQQNIEYLSKLPIKVITHGWKSSADKSAVINIKNAYLYMQNVSVIAVDWSEAADSLFYPIVAMLTKHIGSKLGQFLNALNERYNVSGDHLHLIGHSLGAHVMGNAASETFLNISRITGLDPARPLFEFPNRPDSVKLDKSDAVFVDVIHTCAGILGVMSSIGDADFYPNSGVPPQPGCGDIEKFLEACSHSRSHMYFTESIKNPTSFPTCKTFPKCVRSQYDQYIFMGETVNQNATGKFYLTTNYDYPYGRGLI